MFLALGLLLISGLSNAEITQIASYSFVCTSPDCGDFVLSNPLHRRQFQSNPMTQASSKDGKMLFHIQCERPTNDSMYLYPEEFCTNVVEAFRQAGDILTKYLDLKKPVSVQAKVHSFCTNGIAEGLDGSCKSYIGFARPASLFSVKGDGVVDAWYPQALLRQFDAKVGYKAYDINAEFNTDFDFYFKDSIVRSAGTREKKQISSQEIDFITVAMHELIHGLGMVSAWNRNIPSVAGFDNQRALAPIQADNGQVLGSVFDFHLVSSTPKGKLRWHEAVKSMSPLNSPDALKTAAVIYQSAVTAGGVSFNYPAAVFDPKAKYDQFTGYEALLETNFPEFASGSSIGHVDRSYSKTEDSLMVFSTDYGVSLDALMEKLDGDFEPIGKRTLGILVSIGYKVKPEYADRLRTELQEGTTSAAAACSIGSSSLLTLALLTCMLL